MTAAMNRLRELRERQSKERQRMAELSREAELTVETREELDRIEAGTPDLERQIRAAVTAVETEDAASTETRSAADGLDAEHRERLDLRRRVRLTSFFQSRLGGGRCGARSSNTSRPMACLRARFRCPSWTRTRAIEWSSARRRRLRHRAPRAESWRRSFRPCSRRPLRPTSWWEMPRISTGSYNVPRITTSLTAGWKAKDGVTDSTAAALTVSTSTVKRLSGRMSLRMEDVAAVGMEDFEAAIRSNLQQVVGNALDDALLDGTGTGDEPYGLLARLTDPTDPTQAADFGAFVSTAAGAISASELWGEAGCRTFAPWPDRRRLELSETVFRGNDSYISAAAYLRQQTGGWRSNAHVPAAASNIQQAVQVLLGRPGLSIARMPTWGRLEIDDIYTGAAAAQHFRTVHVLCGDLLVLHPDAYRQVAYKLA